MLSGATGKTSILAIDELKTFVGTLDHDQKN